MVRRAQFQTRVDIKPEDMIQFGNKIFIKEKIEEDDPMVDLPIEKVFAFSRIKRPIKLFHFLFFFFWTPFGICLMTVRVIVMFAFLTIFYMIAPIPYLNKIRKYAPHIFVNIIMPICGIFHSVRGSEYKNAVHVDKCIFVCNHISNFDPIWFNCVFKDFTLLCAGDYDWFWEAMKRIGILSQDDEHGKGCIYTNYFGSVNEREAVRIAIEEDMARDDGRPFLIYPEGCVTTGVCAVMQYQKFVFSLDKVIVPMCLSINNPWPYEHYTLVGHAQDHLLWYLFSPWVTFKHALLPPQKRREGEKPHEFALRVQCMTAAHLGLGVINMNWKEKDRLQQALGFVPYNEALWSRRKSMDIFRENLFKRQVVLKDGHAVVGDKKVMPISADEEEEEMEEGTKCAHGSSKNVIKPNYDENEKNGVFLAKEFAARQHAEREEEMKLFDKAMQKAADASKSDSHRAKEKGDGGQKRERSIRRRSVNMDINKEFVSDVNELRRRISNVGSVDELPENMKVKTHEAEVMERKIEVKAKRRASQIAASEDQMIKLAGGRDKLTAEGLAAIKAMAAGEGAGEETAGRGKPGPPAKEP